MCNCAGLTKAETAAIICVMIPMAVLLWARSHSPFKGLYRKLSNQSGLIRCVCETPSWSLLLRAEDYCNDKWREVDGQVYCHIGTLVKLFFYKRDGTLAKYGYVIVIRMKEISQTNFDSIRKHDKKMNLWSLSRFRLTQHKCKWRNLRASHSCTGITWPNNDRRTKFTLFQPAIF